MFRGLKIFNNISSLQFFHLLRFTTFLIISILFTKSHLTTKEIGDFEIMMFIAGVASFFWVTGLIQSFLSLYNNNKTFPGIKQDLNHKSPEIFNAFLLLLIFSVFICILGLTFRNSIFVYREVKQIPFFNWLLVYFALSNPPHLIEYIYLLRNKSGHIVYYGMISFTILLILVAGPIILGYPLIVGVKGLVISSGLRFIWMIVLLIKHAAFKLSFAFIKDHISLGFPLIISTFLSGSAQYIDGLIIANRYDATAFALFRYGAKELPLVILFANGLSSGMIPEFCRAENFKKNLRALRQKSMRLIQTLFPISIGVLFISDWIFPRMFNEDFGRSSDVFMVYILLIISRLVFPHTILIGLKKTRVVMIASVIEIIINILLSIYMVQRYGLTGVAVATVIVYVVEKFILILYNYFKLGIKPSEYIPVKLHIAYSCVIILLFVLIDHSIIDF